MKPALFLEIALLPALRLLPVEMGSPAAAAMVLAICLQESGLTKRQQMGGPALGYPQFERGGVYGVLTHPASAPAATFVCGALDYPLLTSASVHRGIENNDVLACAFARLLLWTLPGALPSSEEPDKGWEQYISAWRPGVPRRDTWNHNFESAWLAVADATRTQ